MTRRSLPESTAHELQGPGDKETFTFVIRSLDAGGAERQLALLACALAADGHRVEMIIFYGGGEFEEDVKRCGVVLNCLEKRGRWDMVGFGVRLVSAIRKRAGGTVVGFLEGANIMLSACRPLLGGRTVVNRLASTYMDTTRYDWLSGWSFGAELWFAKQADLVITNSNVGLARARKAGVSAARLAVVPNAVDSQRFRPDTNAAAALRAEWGVATGQSVVGIVGRMDPMKDHANFVAAAELILQSRPEVFFICVGGGSDAKYEEAIRHRAQQLVDSGRLIFLGYRSDLPGIYSALDVNVLSSYGEGSPNCIIESMACGTTCVVTDVGDAQLLVGDTGTVVPARDPLRLADGVTRQLDKLAAQPGLAGAARDRVLARHSVASCVDSFRTALASLI